MSFGSLENLIAGCGALLYVSYLPKQKTSGRERPRRGITVDVLKAMFAAVEDQKDSLPGECAVGV